MTQWYDMIWYDCFLCTFIDDRCWSSIVILQQLGLAFTVDVLWLPESWRDAVAMGRERTPSQTCGEIEIALKKRAFGPDVMDRHMYCMGCEDIRYCYKTVSCTSYISFWMVKSNTSTHNSEMDRDAQLAEVLGFVKKGPPTCHAVAIRTVTVWVTHLTVLGFLATI